MKQCFCILVLAACAVAAGCVQPPTRPDFRYEGWQEPLTSDEQLRMQSLLVTADAAYGRFLSELSPQQASEAIQTWLLHQPDVSRVSRMNTQSPAKLCFSTRYGTTGCLLDPGSAVRPLGNAVVQSPGHHTQMLVTRPNADGTKNETVMTELTAKAPYYTISSTPEVREGVSSPPPRKMRGPRHHHHRR